MSIIKKIKHPMKPDGFKMIKVLGNILKRLILQKLKWLLREHYPPCKCHYTKDKECKKRLSFLYRKWYSEYNLLTDNEILPN